jgi:hypothetical protein
VVLLAGPDHQLCTEISDAAAVLNYRTR